MIEHCVYNWAMAYKTGHKIFIIAKPKQGLAGKSPPKLSFGMSSYMKYTQWKQQSTIL